VKLYYHQGSPNGRRAALTAVHLGLDVELTVVDFAKAEHKSDAYTRLNPNQKVPVLVDGDFVLWESNAIMHYLTRKKPEAGLVPADDRGAAEVLRWQFWQVAHWGPSVGTLNFQRVIKGWFGGPSDEAACEAALPEIHKLAGILDQHLRGRKYLVGDRLTLADVSVACTLMFRVPAKVPLEGYGELTRWIESIESLDAWKKTLPG
jgi:glutathione S-transferase